MAYELAPWVSEFVGTTLKTLVGPLAGALAGATAAQAIAKRNAATQRRLEEMRASNAAISTTSSILNFAAALKRQHVRPTKETYDKLSDARDEAVAGGAAGVFHFQADLNTLPPFRPAIPLLERLLYEKVNSTPRILALLALLAQSTAGVNDCIEERNSVCVWLKSRNGVPDEELADIYFGLVNAQGHVDARFRQSLEGLAVNTECCLLFSYALHQELVKHAEAIAADGRPPKGFPEVVRLDFQPIADAGLFPELDEDTRRTFKSLRVEIEVPKPRPDAALAGDQPPVEGPAQP